MQNGWGKVIPENLLAVLNSSMELFEKSIHPENLNSKLAIVQNSRSHNPPIDHPKMYKLASKNIIYLNVEGTYWSKYAYQFAHEYCHHLIESDFINSSDQFGWFEETLCELASIHSIKNMAATWKYAPPYENWVSYAVSLEEYFNEILNRETNNLDYSLSSWLIENIDLLSKDRYLRDKNCLVAKNISDIFFEDPTLWNSITYINRVKIHKEMSFTEFMNSWRMIIPETNRVSWERLKERLLGSCG